MNTFLKIFVAISVMFLIAYNASAGLVDKKPANVMIRQECRDGLAWIAKYECFVNDGRFRCIKWELVDVKQVYVPSLSGNGNPQPKVCK